VDLDRPTPLQTFLLKSLLDMLAALAWACWQRLRERRDALRAREAWRGARPVLKLKPWHLMALKTRRAMLVELQQLMPVNPNVVAVLVSQSGMEEQVRRALGGRTSLRFAATWAALQQVIARESPSAIVADPLADTNGDPEGHLARFSREWRIPVILYTALTPQSARMLLRLARCGIGHIIFRRYDDAPRRFVECVLACGGGRSGPPWQAA
jgi:hypothetical protein